MNPLYLGIAWAGLIMLYDFTMWTCGPLEFWYNILIKIPKWLHKPLGLCRICCCFWLGLLSYNIGVGPGKEYLIFLGASQVAIIPYHILILIYQKIISNK